MSVIGLLLAGFFGFVCGWLSGERDWELVSRVLFHALFYMLLLHYA